MTQTTEPKISTCTKCWKTIYLEPDGSWVTILRVVQPGHDHTPTD